MIEQSGQDPENEATVVGNESEFTSSRAQEAEQSAQDAKDAGVVRKESRAEKRAKNKEARAEKRAARKQAWSDKFKRVKDAGKNAWDAAKKAPETSMEASINLFDSGVDRVDALYTRAQAGIEGKKAAAYQKGDNVTSEASEVAAVAGSALAFMDSLKPRTKAAFAEMRTEVMRSAIKEAQGVIATAHKKLEEASGNIEGIHEPADKIAEKAGQLRDQQEKAKNNTEKLKGVRGFLSRFLS